MCLGIFYVVTDGNTKLCGLASLTAAAAIKKLRLNVFQCLVYHAKPSQSHNKAQMKEAKRPVDHERLREFISYPVLQCTYELTSEK